MYDVNFFQTKLSAIPENLWFVGNYQNPERTKGCVYHWCGLNMTDQKAGNHPEVGALNKLFSKINSEPGLVNDGKDLRYQQSNPKDRILAALVDIDLVIHQPIN